MQEFTTVVRQLFAGKTPWLYFRILLIALLVGNDARLIVVVYEKDSLPVLFLVLFYGIAFFSIALLLLSKSKLVRTLAQILVFSALYTDALYLLLSEFPFSYPDAINLVNNPEYTPAAVSTFRTAFLLAFAGAAIVFALVQRSLKSVTGSNTRVPLFLFITIQASLYLYAKKHPGIHDFFPSAYRVPGNLLTATAFRPEEKWRRAAVTETPGKIRVTHLFLVVDESVTGTALSINRFPFSTTPFLQANAEKFINFGIATSFTNFSAGSNLSLLSGMLLSELPDKTYRSFSKASLFQYAKKAGYKTYLLDAQSDDAGFHNYTTAQDRVFIDSLFQPGVQHPGVALYSRDSIVAEKMAAIAKTDAPAFVYVNKAGAHWPYHTNFPPHALTQDFSAAACNAVPYLKSLAWNVDKFWERLTSKLQDDNSVLILYTSDHGEAFASGSFKIKHASIYKTSTAEGLVPLLVFDRATFFPPNFSPPVNSYSHQYIFPTLLSAMGYNMAFIRAGYGRTLLEPPYPQRRWFQTGDLFGRGKNKRIFVDEIKK